MHAGLKVCWITRTIWVTWVTFLVGQAWGSHLQTELSECDPDV